MTTYHPRKALEDLRNIYLRNASGGGAAAYAAGEALKGGVYPRSSLETAACVWEAVLDMRSVADNANEDNKSEAAQRGRLIAAAFDAHGWSAVRMAAMGWIDAIDEAWAVESAKGYDFPFDWEFVPGWIARNVDWEGPNAPTLRAEPLPLRVPTIAPGDTITTASAAREMVAGDIMPAAAPAIEQPLGQETPVDIACELAEVVEAILLADQRTDATAFAAALYAGGELLARIGIDTAEDAGDGLAETDPAVIIRDGLALLPCMISAEAETAWAGTFVCEHDERRTRYSFTVSLEA